MCRASVHGYDPRESERLHDQAGTLVELLHGDTAYPEESRVLEAGCGVGAQTVTPAQSSPGAHFTRPSGAGSPTYLVDGFTRHTFTAMIEGVRTPALRPA